MKKILSQYKGLPKDLYYICVAQIVNRFGDFVIPFLTLYLTSKLGLSSSFAGVIVMTASIIGMPAAMIGGKTADLVRRKKVYMIFQFLAAVFLIPCAFTMNPWITIICLLTSSFCGSALRPAFMAMVTDILPTCDRQAGLSLNPGTPAKALDYLIDEIDLVLVMSVNPGFGGQSFIASQLRKIEAVRKMIDATGRDIRLEVDGGVNAGISRSCVDAGADVLVAGSAAFSGGPDMYAANIAALKG